MCFLFWEISKMPPYKILVKANWDDDAGVWHVVDSNVPGLNAEAKTQKGLERILRQMVPELVELNGLPHSDVEDDCSVPLELIYRQRREFALGC